MSQEDKLGVIEPSVEGEIRKSPSQSGKKRQVSLIWSEISPFSEAFFVQMYANEAPGGTYLLGKLLQHTSCKCSHWKMCFLFAEVWHVSSLSHWTSPTPLEPWSHNQAKNCGEVCVCVCFFFKILLSYIHWYMKNMFLDLIDCFFFEGSETMTYFRFFSWIVNQGYFVWWPWWPLKHQFSTFQKCQSSHAHSGEARGDFRASEKKKGKAAFPGVPWEFFVEFF